MGLLSSISSFTDDKSRAKAFLAEVDPTSEAGSELPGTVRSFQYFPESINDSRGVNYATKEVIGGSHPIYQWTHGSERTISFDAIFTADYSDLPATSASSVLSTIGGIASAIKNPLGTLLSAAGGKDEDKISLAAAVAWLRSKTYPSFAANPSNKVSAPPVLLLYLPGSGITSSVRSADEADIVPCLMRRCDIHYEAFFNNGAPRIVTVSLEFAETVQVGSAWSFVDRSDIETTWLTQQQYTEGSGQALPGRAAGANGLGSLLPQINLPKISLF